jgi:hypothetical protein
MVPWVAFAKRAADQPPHLVVAERPLIPGPARELVRERAIPEPDDHVHHGPRDLVLARIGNRVARIEEVVDDPYRVLDVDRGIDEDARVNAKARCSASSRTRKAVGRPPKE